MTLPLRVLREPWEAPGECGGTWPSATAYPFSSLTVSRDIVCWATPQAVVLKSPIQALEAESHAQEGELFKGAQTPRKLTWEPNSQELGPVGRVWGGVEGHGLAAQGQ